jgi:hypothetical protein
MAPDNCQGFLLAWALGQTGNDWLDNFALPIGGGIKKKEKRKEKKNKVVE